MPANDGDTLLLGAYDWYTVRAVCHRPERSEYRGVSRVRVPADTSNVWRDLPVGATEADARREARRLATAEPVNGYRWTDVRIEVRYVSAPEEVRMDQ